MQMQIEKRKVVNRLLVQKSPRQIQKTKNPRKLNARARERVMMCEEKKAKGKSESEPPVQPSEVDHSSSLTNGEGGRESVGSIVLNSKERGIDQLGSNARVVVFEARLTMY